MNNDAIIFDIDGTLWNACSTSAKGWNMGLAKLGIDKKVSSKQIKSVVGNPYEECVEMLLPGLQKQYPDLLDTINNYKIKVFKSDGGILYNGVVDGIKTLSKSHKIFLVSNCQDWYIKFFINFSGLEPLLTDFDCNGISHLPKHKMLMKIKNKHSLNNPVYIGDTEGDEIAANLADVDFIHVSYGFGPLSGKAMNFNSFVDLVNYLKKQKQNS